MTHWNHRVMRAVDEHGEESFTIREVFYDDDRNVEGWTGPIDPYGETLEGLRATLKLMLIACARPVLEDDDA